MSCNIMIVDDSGSMRAGSFGKAVRLLRLQILGAALVAPASVDSPASLVS